MTTDFRDFEDGTAVELHGAVSVSALVPTTQAGRPDKRYGAQPPRSRDGLCATCHVEPRRKRGYNCKGCHAKWMRENRPKYGELSPLQQKKANARAAARQAIRRGNLKRRGCKFRACKRKAQMHHNDYDKPLVVEWICRFHHMKHRHGENGHA